MRWEITTTEHKSPRLVFKLGPKLVHAMKTNFKGVGDKSVRLFKSGNLRVNDAN